MKSKESAVEEVPARRKRGRPPKATAATANENGSVLTREQILEKATELAKVEPLGEISMVGLARELGVTPALIHYYVGSRDDLISGVANRYFQARLAQQRPLTGDWEQDLWQEAMQTFRMGVEYGGVLRYMMSHNRFRLFQQVAEGEVDYGLQYLNRMAGIFRTGGFTSAQAATGYHLLSLYVMSSAYAEVSRQLPGFHEHYIRGQIEAHPREERDDARFFLDDFATLDSAKAFPAGLRLMIDGFRGWLLEPAAAPPRSRKKVR
jgi:AcrR family transcriptional regulator